MRYILLLIVLMVGCDIVFAQDVPSGYTSEIGLRLYDLDDYPGADSLNANAQAIDAFAAATNDTMDALKADIYSAIKYTGGLKAGVVNNASLATEVDTSRLKTTGTDYIYGIRYNLGTSNFFKNVLPAADNVFWLGHSVLRWYYGYVTHFRTEDLFIVNTAQDDSGGISYANNEFVFDKRVSVGNMKITNNLDMDSSASFGSLQIAPHTYIPTDVADSVFATDTLYSNFLIQPPGDMANVNSLDMTAPYGQIVMMYHTDAADTITLKANATWMKRFFKMSSNVTLAAFDMIAFILIYDPVNGDCWRKLWEDTF